MNYRNIRLAFLVLVGMQALPMGCIPYVKRTSYDAFSSEPTAKGHADITRPVIQFGFHRELINKTYPFVQVLGEKGDFALSIGLRGEGAKPYWALVLQHLQIVAHGKTLFATSDSAFVKEVFQSAEAALINKDDSKYYRSSYVIALDDTLKKPLLQVDYDLIRQDGKRQHEHLHQFMQLDRQRGFTGY